MAATNGDDVFRPTDEASIALLRGLRTKTIVDHSFIHHADVCSAAPEELVADLQPVPGTDVTEDGYNSVWYIYCPKRYKKTSGKPGGHRQRAVEPDGKTCWHLEKGPKPVEGVPGATFCNFSYGRKKEKEGRQRFDRMGWCMTEFDDTQDGGGGGDHVLCRVHRSSSSRAKRKFKSSSSSSSKRKAAGDHPDAPPSKLINNNEQVQMQMQVKQNPTTFFTNAYPDPAMPWYGYGPPKAMDPVTMDVGGEDECGVQQPVVEPEYGGEFNLDESFNKDEQVQMMVQQDPTPFFNNAYPTMPCYDYGPSSQNVDPVTMVGREEDRGVQLPRAELEADLVDNSEFNVEKLLDMEEFKNDAYSTTTMPGYVHGGPQAAMDPATMFGGQEEEQGVQQSHIELEAEHGGDLGGFNLEELLNTDDWKGFLQMLQAEVEKEQQQQPSAEPEQGGGIVISGSLLYAC